MEKASLGFIIRDFSDDGLATNEATLEAIVKNVMSGYRGSSYIQGQAAIPQHCYAIAAGRRAGLTSERHSFAAIPMAQGCHSWACPSQVGAPCRNPICEGLM
ncbi:hypothetical protein G6M87_32375 (plasmid) [Rhizobium rhizogenes]|uniref:hypothetical protein n=1 Tax=Rhizobium rhizogenes TaxID=359 RepID=UPI00157244EC|nr:hypothetical protein [Rhizobium rhizogenes]NTI26912.1 hypothetical protein [Rhizobium rhizogenes]QTG10242.1 hypothetical protein G6M87_32375 [Rhizobium rhizogenes]